MKTIRLLVFITLATQLSVVAAEDTSLAIPAVDTTNWKCKYCVLEEGWHGEVELGFGHVSDDSFKFGEYNGLNEDGLFSIANARLSYLDEDAYYLDLSVSDLGLDTRSLSIKGGQQGRYKLFLRYDEIPHFISSTATTPYIGSGNDLLTLPGAWVAAGTTTGMTGLTSSLQSVNLETQRKRLDAGLSVSINSPWEYAINFRHETKEGAKHAAGTFFFSTAQLIEPVDYVTDEVDASVSYNTQKWQANLAYFASTFRNNNSSLIWQNAYTPIIAGMDSGQLALAPDNQFHQFILSSAYKLNARNHLSGNIAIGRMQQDEKLLSATQNASLIVSPLLNDSADARVNTVNAKLKLVSIATEKLRLNATLTYNDRDNKTPQLLYDWVTTDAVLAVPRTNIPYSFTKSVVKLSANYKLAKYTKLGIGFNHDKHKRTFQEVDKTTENTLWGSVRIRSIENILVELKLAQSERDTSSYEVVSTIDPAQNILLSKYNMADRGRTTISLHTSITPQAAYTIGLNLDIAQDDYDKSVLGLMDSKDINLNADVSAMLTENTTVNFFIGRQNIESTQTGSQTFSAADWSANNDDTVDNIGISATHVLIEDKLDIGIDYTKLSSTGKVRVNSGAPDPVFPDLSTDLDSFKLYANYRLKENLTLKAAYWHERYDASDWALDGVSSDTIPNLLSLSELSPSYNTNVVKLSMSYTF